MKRAVVYQRKGRVFVRTASFTDAGLWVETGPCSTFAEDVESEALGAALQAHLNASCSIPHPTDWKAVQAPLLAAAGVKSWNTFGMIARCVGVRSSDEGVLIEPRQNNKPGFWPIDGAAIRLERQPSARALGEAVKAAIEASR